MPQGRHHMEPRTPPATKVQSGFTLIEVMIVVALIGIVSSLAISSVQEYTTRARVMEIIQFARRDQDLLREYFHLNGTVPDNPADVGILVSSDRSDYLSGNVVIEWNGTQATLTYPLDMGADAVGTLIFIGLPQGSDLRFNCASPDFPQRYLPRHCQT
jgi:type IV pilus assembly protein PilA